MLSIPHMLVVFVIVLVVFGPQKLPELARSLGKMLAEFRKASADFRGAFEEEMRDLERQAREVERKKAADTATANAAAEGPVQAATFATPAGAETSAFPANQDGWVGGAAAVDTSGNAVDTRTTEAAAGLVETPVTELVVTPVTEAVARGSEDAAGSETGLENFEGGGEILSARGTTQNSPAEHFDPANANGDEPSTVGAEANISSDRVNIDGKSENASGSSEVSGAKAPVLLDVPHDQHPA